MGEREDLAMKRKPESSPAQNKKICPKQMYNVAGEREEGEGKNKINKNLRNNWKKMSEMAFLWKRRNI